MATRGHLGGLARATADAVDVLDAAGYDEILVETVGVGQDEVEVFRLAESCVVVLTPGMGDDIQAIKAGLMEVADLFVVNKADRDGADRVVQEILQMLELGEHGAWIPPVVKTVATTGAGLDELAARLAEHRAFLDGPQGAARKRERTKMRIEGLVRENFLRRVERLRGNNGALDEAADRVEARKEDPLSAARGLVAHIDRGAAGAEPRPSSPSKKSSSSSSPKLAPGTKININTASKEELDALPEIGPVKAQAIVDYRNANGKFAAPEDIMKVSGIKEGTFAKIKDYIVVK
jgi:comEA protein